MAAISPHLPCESSKGLLRNGYVVVNFHLGHRKTHLGYNKSVLGLSYSVQLTSLQALPILLSLLIYLDMPQ